MIEAFINILIIHPSILLFIQDWIKRGAATDGNTYIYLLCIQLILGDINWENH